MSVLERIVASTKQELIQTKESVPLEKLLGRIPEEPPVSLTSALAPPGVNIIAEIKYKSPSRGEFTCQLPCRESGWDLL